MHYGIWIRRTNMCQRLVDILITELFPNPRVCIIEVK
jgi:hypothetical protein